MNKISLLKEIEMNLNNPEKWIDPYDSEKITNRYIRGISKRISYFFPGFFYKTNLFEKKIWDENYILLGQAALNLKEKELVKIALLKLDITNRKHWGLPINWHSGEYIFPESTLMSTTTSECILFLCEVYETYPELIEKKLLIDLVENLLSKLNKNFIGNNEYLYSYTPLDNYKIFNSNLLVAAATGVVGKLTNKNNLMDEALKIFKTCDKYIPIDGYVPYELLGSENTSDSYHQLFSMRAAYYFKKYNLFDSKLLTRMESYYFRRFYTNGYVILKPDKKVLDLQPFAESLRYFGLSNNKESFDKLYKHKSILMKKNSYIQRVWNYDTNFPLKSNVCHSRQGYLRLILALSYS